MLCTVAATLPPRVLTAPAAQTGDNTIDMQSSAATSSAQLTSTRALRTPARVPRGCVVVAKAGAGASSPDLTRLR